MLSINGLGNILGMHKRSCSEGDAEQRVTILRSKSPELERATEHLKELDRAFKETIANAEEMKQTSEKAHSLRNEIMAEFKK